MFSLTIKASPTRRAIATGILVGIPTTALLLCLASRGLDPGSVWNALRRADPVRIALSVGVIAVIYCLQAARWKWLVRQLGAPAWRTVLRFVLGAVAVNNVVPGRPGEIMRGYWMARATKASPARAYGTVIVDRSFDVLALTGLLICTYPFTPHPDWLRRIVLVAAAAAGVIMLWVLVTRWHTRRSPARRPAPGRLRSSWVSAQLSGLAHGTATAVHGPDALALGLLSTAVWLLWALAAWLVAGSLGVPLSPIAAIFITAAINLGAALPSSPGFIGTFQYVSVAGLGLFGVAHSSAFAFSILMTAVWYVPTTVAGLGIAVWGSRSLYRRGRIPSLRGRRTELLSDEEVEEADLRRLGRMCQR